MKKFIALSLSLAGMLFCSSLFAQDPIPVSGVTNNLLKRIVTFGDYSTSKVKAVKHKSTLSTDIIDISWAKMVFTFTQSSPSAQAEVKASADPNAAETAEVRKLIGLKDKGNALFSGTIGAAQAWTFCVNAGAKPSDDECGKLLAADGTTISITGGDDTKTKDLLRNKIKFIYNFILNGEKVGSVMAEDNMEVWIKEGLDSDMQLAIAATSSALLTRIGMSQD